ncbi:MAG TPA: CHAD domain-containing protein [Candidatus Binatia bacterium]|nr:CHAD domain-containing protein [Candidatus Binatia bacterium]
MPSPLPKTRVSKATGLRYWMLAVLDECERVSKDFAADPVHDLRVALRRCRSLADGVMALDPDPGWKAMKKAGKRLFQRLGALRDTQVMMGWIETVEELLPRAPSAGGEWLQQDPGREEPETKDPVAAALLGLLRTWEKEQKLDAQAALEEFDRKQWRQWSKSLPARAAHFRPGSALFKHLALERWAQARELHNRALRNRSKTALHNLRIGIKRFRYIVENFLPAQHKAWADDLKEMQDLLGEVHDLDVLWATALACHIFPDAQSRKLWHEIMVAERGKRVERYRARMIGPACLWNIWRGDLPQGRQIQVLTLRRMKLWAGGLDPDFAHSERVSALALQLYEGLLNSGWKPAVDPAAGRASLFAAALLHDVGKSAGEKGHHKASLSMIRAHGIPLGWSAADLSRAAVVARFHRGALPRRSHKSLRDLLPQEQKAIIELSGVLRLANALDATHDGRIRRIQVEKETGNIAHGHAGANGFKRKSFVVNRGYPLFIAAEGYSPLGRSAQTIAAERHLLETVLRRPVVVKAMKHSLAR